MPSSTRTNGGQTAPSNSPPPSSWKSQTAPSNSPPPSSRKIVAQLRTEVRRRLTQKFKFVTVLGGATVIGTFLGIFYAHQTLASTPDQEGLQPLSPAQKRELEVRVAEVDAFIEKFRQIRESAEFTNLSTDSRLETVPYHEVRGISVHSEYENETLNHTVYGEEATKVVSRLRSFLDTLPYNVGDEEVYVAYDLAFQVMPMVLMWEGDIGNVPRDMYIDDDDDELWDIRRDGVEPDGDGADRDGADAKPDGDGADERGADAELDGDDADERGADAELDGDDANGDGADAEPDGDDADGDGADAKLDGDGAGGDDDDDDDDDIRRHPSDGGVADDDALPAGGALRGAG